MKKFNLEAAKKGHKVCTGAGLPARIICFDVKNEDFPIVALVDSGNAEEINNYTPEGKYYSSGEISDSDLFLDTEKHEGWINLYRDAYGIIEPGSTIYPNKEKAIKNAVSSKVRVDTIKIEWED